jgi:hypothetical protein
MACIYSIHLKRSIESSFASHLIRIKAALIFKLNRSSLLLGTFFQVYSYLVRCYK